MACEYPLNQSKKPGELSPPPIFCSLAFFIRLIPPQRFSPFFWTFLLHMHILQWARKGKKVVSNRNVKTSSSPRLGSRLARQVAPAIMQARSGRLSQPDGPLLFCASHHLFRFIIALCVLDDPDEPQLCQYLPNQRLSLFSIAPTSK